MNWRLALLGRTLIPSVKLHMLDELARVTAEGFETAPPDWAGSTFQARIAEYAGFTAHHAGLLVAAGDDIGDRSRQRAGSARARPGWGLRCAERLGIRERRGRLRCPQAVCTARLGIEVEGGTSGEITVGRCFFADYYNEDVCRVIEALDQGIVAGLFDGASLAFSERLTGGRPCCRASPADHPGRRDEARDRDRERRRGRDWRPGSWRRLRGHGARGGPRVPPVRPTI